MSECAGAEGRVYAFEPQPELNEHLESLKEAFALDNVTVTGQGLSSEPGVLELQRSRVGAGQAGVNLPPGTFDEVIKDSTVSVRIRGLEGRKLNSAAL